jgi:hypothetical protein
VFRRATDRIALSGRLSAASALELVEEAAPTDRHSDTLDGKEGHLSLPPLNLQLACSDPIGPFRRVIWITEGDPARA